MPGGLGFDRDPAELLAQDLTTRPDQLNSTVTPIAPEIDVLGETEAPPATKEPPLIDFGDNPLGAIGAVLTNVARGARGQRLFTEELQDRRIQTEQREMKRLTVGVDAMSKGLELVKNTSAAARGDVIKKYGQLFEGALPGFTEALEQAAQQPAATEAEIEELGEFGSELITIGGSLEDARKLRTKPQFMQEMREQRDARNLPEIVQAFSRVDKIMKASPEGQELLRQAAEDGFTVSDLQDPKLQEAIGITKSHVNSIARNPEIQSILRPLGFVPTTDLDEQATAAPKSVYNTQTGKLEFATVAEIRDSDGVLVPAEAKPDKGAFQSVNAVNVQTGEFLDQPVRFDPLSGIATTEDGRPLPEGYVPIKGSVTAAKPGDIPLSRGAQTATENELRTIDDSLANLEKVQADFDPKFLQVFPNLKIGAMANLEKLGKELSPEQMAEVEQFANFKQDAIQVVNEGIKAITGAAMTESEAVRITKQFANVEDDSPTQFKAKIDNAAEKTRLAKTRRQWLLKNGAAIDFSKDTPSVSLDSFQTRFNNRIAQIEDDVREANPDLSEEEVTKRTEVRLLEEFGP
tara:strand:- start:10810 stop:12537 length:1728 start_codon:yes stop_codon:yes gene_type:complete